MSLFDTLSNQLSGQSGQSINPSLSIGQPNVLASTLNVLSAQASTGALVGALNANINSATRQLIGQGVQAVNNLATGNLDALALQALQFVPGGANAEFLATPNPLFGGLSPAMAMQIYQRSSSTKRSLKNLWLLQVKSYLMGDYSDIFNFFATEVEYSPFIVGGDKIKIGSAAIDTVNASEPTEFRVTTYDDSVGSLKQWFAAHAVASARQDGTVGLPSQYAVVITIIHNSVSLDASALSYRNIGFFRVNSIENSLSRSNQEFEQITMSFTQLDTFMTPPGA